MLRLRPTRVRWSALAVAFASASASALGCEVRVETPPDDDRRDHDESEFLPGGDYPADDVPPLRPPSDGDDLPSEYEPSGPSEPPLGASEPYADLSPSLYPALIVLDVDTIQGPRADSASAGAPFSFRTQMEWLAGERDPIDFTRAWLEQWETVTAVGTAEAPVVPRPAVRDRLLQPWLGELDDVGGAASAEGGPYAPVADDTDEAGGAGASWTRAPFRLIAIVNRVDLASDPCATGGELRYIYTAVDPAAGDPLEMTAILEIPYPGTRPAAAWARAWRDLAQLPIGEAQAAALERLANEVRTEADPLRVRLLTSEIELASAASPGWEMREFHLQIDGDRLALRQAPLDRTPRHDVDAARLSQHVLTHADAIRTSGVALPDELQAGAAFVATPDFRWRVIGVSVSLSHAFSVQTCNGCHGGDTQALPFQHVMPIEAPGIAARVSRFLYDPDAPSDELRRRQQVLEAFAQTACEPSAGEPAYP